jgi:hypothetical protein
MQESSNSVFANIQYIHMSTTCVVSTIELLYEIAVDDLVRIDST